MADFSNVRIQLKFDTLANWKKSTLGLLRGEVAFAEDTGEYRIGDGNKGNGTNQKKTWSELPAPKLAAVVLNRAPIAADSDYQVGQLWIDSSDNGRLYVMDMHSNWQGFAFYEEWEQCMLTEEYVGDTAVKAVRMADTLLTNGKYVSVDDNTNKGLWSASGTEKKIKDAKAEAVEEAVEDVKNMKGRPDGIASLDENGQVPATQLPSYVDDIIEAATLAELPTKGETGKIYVVKNDGKDNEALRNCQYRWTGTQYVQITSGNITVEGGSSVAYSKADGHINRDVITAVTEAINGLAYSAFTYDTLNKKTIEVRLAELEEFRAIGIKACVIKKEDGTSTNLIETNDLANLSVTNETLAANAVTTDKIEDYAVTTNKLANGSVTSDKIALQTITRDNLSLSLQSLFDEAGSGLVLKDGSVTTSVIADNAVNNAKVAQNSLSWDRLSNTEEIVFDCGKSS